MALNLFEETTALLAELERHEIPYAVAGALALAIHGVPRATTDIDLLIVNENLEPVWALRERVPTERGDVWVVLRRGLIDMKAWAAREQDLADIRRLGELDR